MVAMRNAVANVCHSLLKMLKPTASCETNCNNITMAPRKSRRLLEPSSTENASEEPYSAQTMRFENEPDPNARLHLVQLPPELFDAIIENYRTLPSTFYYDTFDIPDLKYYERNEVLTALSQTCRTLRGVTLPRLWARLDLCRVPERARTTWYKYTMLAIERKARGISVSPVRHHVRWADHLHVSDFK
jgi:hypothetical protein